MIRKYLNQLFESIKSSSKERAKIFIFLIAETLLFLFGTVFLAFFAGNQKWLSFFVCAVVAVALYVTLRYFEIKPKVDEIRFLEKRELFLSREFRRRGIMEFYNMQDPEQQSKRNLDTQEVILRASMMCLSANSGASYIDPGIERHWPFVEKRLEAGITFRLLLLDPFSLEKKARDRLNSFGEEPDSKFRFDVLGNLYNKYNNFEVRIVSSSMYCTIFFTESYMFYDPYHLGKVSSRITNRFFCLKLKSQTDFFSEENSDVTYFEILKRHFDSLWSISSDFEDYYIENKDLIESRSIASLELNFRRRH